MTKVTLTTAWSVEAWKWAKLSAMVVGLQKKIYLSQHMLTWTNEICQGAKVVCAANLNLLTSVPLFYLESTGLGQ